jgi:polygalacturonase
VSEILYHDVCLRGTRAPIDIYTHYEQSDTPGALTPDYRDIRMEQVHSLTPGKVKLQGYDDAHPLQLRLKDVVIDGKPAVNTEFARVSGTASLLGAGANAIDCSGRFPAFPAEPARNTRPQLSAEQAKAYERSEVLKYVGPLGAERIDPWDPLADPLARGAAFTPDYTVDANAKPDGVVRFVSVQAAVNKAIADARGKRAHIRIQPGVYRELLYVPGSGTPITLYSDSPDPRAVRIVAGLDASTTGADYRQRYGAQFDGAPAAVRAMYEQLKDLPALSTSGSGTAWIRGDGFQARNLTIENGFNREGTKTRSECVGDRCPDNTGGSRVHHGGPARGRRRPRAVRERAPARPAGHAVPELPRRRQYRAQLLPQCACRGRRRLHLRRHHRLLRGLRDQVDRRPPGFLRAGPRHQPPREVWLRVQALPLHQR